MSAEAALPTGTWQLDADATTVTVTVKKLGLFTVPAQLTVTSGSIEVDSSHQVVSVDIMADSSSYASKNAKRNEHVIGADFLDADAHPSISFHTGNVFPHGDGYQTTGTVTVKGQTSPIDVTISDVRFDADSGSFTATAAVDRTAVGIDNLPTFIVGRTLQLTVSAVASKSA